MWRSESKLEMAIFYTATDIPDNLPRLPQADRLMLLGSCFAANMGSRLRMPNFIVRSTPYGVLYNPHSISAALREMLSGKEYAQEDLFRYRGLWHSAMHHGMFSAEKAEDVLEGINRCLKNARGVLEERPGLPAHHFWHRLHKRKRLAGWWAIATLPEREFVRRKLSVEEIVSDYTSLLSEMWMVIRT